MDWLDGGTAAAAAAPGHQQLSFSHPARSFGAQSRFPRVELAPAAADRYMALELIEDALNLKTSTVYDLDADKKPVLHAQATEAAREKQERIKERLKEWTWSDDSRRERLCRLYNDTCNHTRVRTFNGDRLTLPGASGAI